MKFRAQSSCHIGTEAWSVTCGMGGASKATSMASGMRHGKAGAEAAALVRVATATARTLEPSSRDSEKAARCWSHRHRQYQRDLDEHFCALCETLSFFVY